MAGRRTFLIRGLVLAVVAALTIAVAPGVLLPVFAVSWLAVWVVGLAGSLRRRDGTWRARLVALGVAGVVLVICHWLPVKYIDKVVGPASYPEMPLEKLGARMAEDGILPYMHLRPDWCDRKASFTIDRPMTRRAVLQKLAGELDAEASIGYCGTGSTVLWGSHPILMSIWPKGEPRRRPFVPPIPVRTARMREAIPGGGAGVVRDVDFNFEIAIPSAEWIEIPPSEGRGAHIRAHLHTEYPKTDPLATCDVSLMVVPLTELSASQSPDEISVQWQPVLDGLSCPRELKHGETKLGGQDCYYRDVKGEYGTGVGHVTWYLGKMGRFIYVLHVFRWREAVGDTQLEREIRKIVDSFQYLRVIEVQAGEEQAEEQERIDPEKIRRERITLAHSRLEVVKPEGMLNVVPEQFTDSEKANNVVAKFNRRVQQSFVEIRIYAQSAQSQKYTLDQLAQNTLTFWEKTYKMRLKPEIDEKYKFPMAKKAIKMRLVGRRTIPETYTWILAQCKNDRQYRISIYTTGATGETIWKAQIEDFLQNIQPLEE